VYAPVNTLPAVARTQTPFFGWLLSSTTTPSIVSPARSCSVTFSCQDGTAFPPATDITSDPNSLFL